MLGRQRRARGGQGVALLLLLVRQIQRLERKPPVTLALMALMYYLHVQHARYERWFKPLYLCPDRVIYGWELSRVVASAFLHVDDLHLYHNMMSFLWKGYNLEHKLGGLKLLAVVGFLLVLSHALVIVVALALASLFHEPAPLHQCSIGFSGVLFALKVLLNHDSPATSSVYGLRVPTKYAAWLELVMIHVLVPRSSFMGHMCGILAGYMYVYSPGIQRSLSTVARTVEQFARKLLVPAARAEPRSSTASRSPAGVARVNTRFESDEELARRLQEEEFLAAEARPRSSSRDSRDNPIPVDVDPQPIDANELRCRRLARLGGASR